MWHGIVLTFVVTQSCESGSQWISWKEGIFTPNIFFFMVVYFSLNKVIFHSENHRLMKLQWEEAFKINDQVQCPYPDHEEHEIKKSLFCPRNHKRSGTCTHISPFFFLSLMFFLRILRNTIQRTYYTHGKRNYSFLTSCNN